MVKNCARCGAKFEDVEGFVTCHSCRVPSPAHDTPGGCQFWGSVVPTRFFPAVMHNGGGTRRFKHEVGG